jgi:hypothetical protein
MFSKVEFGNGNRSSTYLTLGVISWINSGPQESSYCSSESWSSFGNSYNTSGEFLMINKSSSESVSTGFVSESI